LPPRAARRPSDIVAPVLTASTQRTLGWGVFALALAWFLALPLSDVLAYPERLSVLPNLETDAAAYDAFAQEFSQTWQQSSLPAKHPPGWMVLLASVYAMFGHSYVAGKIVSWLALVLTVALTAWLAHRMNGRTAAIIAALLCASSPGLRAYVGTLQYEVLTAALFTLLLVLSVRTASAPTTRDALTRAACAGAAGAALVLTRETFVLVVPIAALWIWSQPAFAPGGAPAG
jgi:4-amino-4-deoxy-L-arabinose transferase-like glycosyltransferase